MAFGLQKLWHCIRLALCFTGAKEQFFSQKTLKKDDKIVQMFITHLNFDQSWNIVFLTNKLTHRAKKWPRHPDGATNCKP